MKEIWKDVQGYGGKYMISNLRNVDTLHFNRRRLPGFEDNFGYLAVKLCDGRSQTTRRIHRLVAIAFIDNPDSLNEVNHIDGNKKNNAVENLEWCTHRDNMRHAYNTGLMNMEDAINSIKKKVLCVTTGEIYESSCEASRITGIVQQSISKVATGKMKQTHRLVFKYID